MDGKAEVKEQAMKYLRPMLRVLAGLSDPWARSGVCTFAPSHVCVCVCVCNTR